MMPKNPKDSETQDNPTVTVTKMAINGHPARCMGMNKVFNAVPAFQISIDGIVVLLAMMPRACQDQFVCGRARTCPG